MLGQPRTTQRRARKVASDEGALRGDIVRLASRFGRYGYRRVTDMLRIEGWGVNHKRVERIWRQEGLKVPQRQPKRGRLWLNDGSCIRLRPLYRGHVWSYDFVASRTHDGRALKLLTVLDEHTRECLAIVVARKIRAHDVLEVLADLFVRHGPPEYLRSDNGPEFTAKLVRRWLGRVGIEMLFIEPGSPWENGYNESFNGKLRDELLKLRSRASWRRESEGWTPMLGGDEARIGVAQDAEGEGTAVLQVGEHRIQVAVVVDRRGVLTDGGIRDRRGHRGVVVHRVDRHREDIVHRRPPAVGGAHRDRGGAVGVGGEAEIQGTVSYPDARGHEARIGVAQDAEGESATVFRVGEHRIQVAVVVDRRGVLTDRGVGDRRGHRRGAIWHLGFIN